LQSLLLLLLLLLLFSIVLGHTASKKDLDKNSVRTYSNYQLIAHFLYSSTICMLHYDPQHVSSSTLLETCWGS